MFYLEMGREGFSLGGKRRDKLLKNFKDVFGSVSKSFETREFAEIGRQSLDDPEWWTVVEDK